MPNVPPVMAETTTHVPVLVDETLRALAPAPGKTFLDGTAGHGGHAAALLAATAPDGRLLGIDRDPRNLAVATERLKPFGARAVLARGSYEDMRDIAASAGVGPFDGVLLDVGFSSAHVDDPDRGFSFQSDGPLDMRYDPDHEETAAMIVNGWTKDELARLFRVYGEEPQAARIAAALVEARRRERFTRTGQLAEAIAAVLPRRGRTHPATRAFQALRIAVNDELGALERALPEALSVLKPGGRLVVISFHSLEDRIVKRFLAEREDVRALTKRPVTATPAEIARNPRARSAKLRAAQLL